MSPEDTSYLLIDWHFYHSTYLENVQPQVLFVRAPVLPTTFSGLWVCCFLVLRASLLVYSTFSPQHVAPLLCQSFAAPVTQWHDSLFLLPKMAYYYIREQFKWYHKSSLTAWWWRWGWRGAWRIKSLSTAVKENTLSSYFALSVSASATLLINTQGSWSDMQWPAWVSPVVNNKLFGFRESGFCLIAALFSQWPHCGIWRELWRCGQNSNNNKYIMVAFLSSIFY